MKTVISVRDALKKLYTDYDIFLRPVLRFIVSFLFLCLLRSYIGFNDKLCEPLSLLVLSLVCALFPAGCMTLVCACFVLGNMFSVSYALFLIGAAVSVLVVLLYFGFRPGKGFYILLVPMGFLLKMPYAVPVILALGGGLTAAVPVSIGVVFWYLISFFHENSASLTAGTDLSDIISEFALILKSLCTDKDIYVMLAAFLLCIGLVVLISRLSLDHSWTIAVCLGLVLLTCIRVSGVYLFGMSSLQTELVRFAFSLPAVLIYELLFYSVDYRQTEHLQFEDEDYYYYVKAVPKLRSDDDYERKD